LISTNYTAFFAHIPMFAPRLSQKLHQTVMHVAPKLAVMGFRGGTERARVSTCLFYKVYSWSNRDPCRPRTRKSANLRERTLCVSARRPFQA